MEPFDLRRYRANHYEALLERPLDVLVVGGGIVGAGVARDAAMRALRVGLIEQHDLAFGTSSRSSRLLHGGLRYLAQGRIMLVYQASREKLVLRRIAPHLVQPLAFVFPAYRGKSWPLWQLRLGVKLYDLLCSGNNFGRSEYLSPDKTLACVPGLASAGLSGAVRYYDALTNDARLVIDTHRSAARHGAVICNYTRLEKAEPAAAGWQCSLSDVLSGRQYQVLARTVVNATGPWGQSIGPSRVRLRLTKGVHLVIDRRRLPLTDAVVMTEDGRILFAIPWLDRVILGTTDTDYHGAPEAVRTEAEDLDYVLGLVNRFFPRAGLGPADVLSTWAGLRALVGGQSGQPSDISRAHRIEMPEPGWLNVFGGKLTTYRLIGQQVVDALVRYLGRSSLPCRTAVVPLLADCEPGFSSVAPPEVSEQAVVHFCRNEWAIRVEDVMIRRTGWHYCRPDARDVAIRVAGWMANVFGWDAATRDAELARYRSLP